MGDAGSLFCSVRRQQCTLFLRELYEYNQSRILKNFFYFHSLHLTMQQSSTLTYRKKQIYFLVIVNTKMHPDWRHALQMLPWDTNERSAQHIAFEQECSKVERFLRVK